MGLNPGPETQRLEENFKKLSKTLYEILEKLLKMYVEPLAAPSGETLNDADLFHQVEQNQSEAIATPPSRPGPSDPDTVVWTEDPAEDTANAMPSEQVDSFVSLLQDWALNRCPESGWTRITSLREDPNAPLWVNAEALGLDDLSHKVLCLALANAIKIQTNLDDAANPEGTDITITKALFELHLIPPTGWVRLTEALQHESPLCRLGYLDVDQRLHRGSRRDPASMGMGQFLRLRFGVNAFALGRLLGPAKAKPTELEQASILREMVLPESVRKTLDRLLACPELLHSPYRILIKAPEHFGGCTLAQGLAQHVQQPLKRVKPWDGAQPGCVALVLVERNFDADDWESLQDHPGLMVFRQGDQECRFDLESACNLTLDLNGLTKGEMILFANRQLKQAGDLFRNCNPVEVVGSGLTPGSLVDAISKLKAEAAWQGHDSEAIPDLLKKAVKRVLKEANEHTVTVRPSLTLTDLCLDQNEMNRFIKMIQSIRGRQATMSRWNLDPGLVGKSTVALLHGPSGTGKTMAAEVLAHELGLPIKKVEASSLESPYVGESEQKLHKFFEQIRKDGPAVVLLDEADSVLNDRSTAEGSTRRYQVSLVNAWLRELDAGTEGAVLVLTTNHFFQLDQSLERRVNFRLGFREPGASIRQNIWTNLFGRVPIPGVQKLNLKVIAEGFRFSGGRIRNAFMAALQAAGDTGEITQEILRTACQEELESSLPKERETGRRIVGFGGDR